MSEALFRKSNLLMISPPLCTKQSWHNTRLIPAECQRDFLFVPRPAPLPLHGSPLRRAACAVLTVASSEPHVPLTLRRPGGVMHVVLNNISNSFLELKISGLKISRSMVGFEDEKKALIPSLENFYNVNNEL